MEENQKNEWVSTFRAMLRQLLELFDGDFQQLDARWTALDYTTNLTDGDLAGGPHDGLLAAQVATAVTSMRALKTELDTGHNTNLYTVR